MVWDSLFAITSLVRPAASRNGMALGEVQIAKRDSSDGDFKGNDVLGGIEAHTRTPSLCLTASSKSISPSSFHFSPNPGSTTLSHISRSGDRMTSNANRF
jgi:hypothetical protein